VLYGNNLLAQKRGVELKERKETVILYTNGTFGCFGVMDMVGPCCLDTGACAKRSEGTKKM